MKFIDSVFQKLKPHPKRIVFPEGTEPRVIQAAAQFAKAQLGVPILLGRRDDIAKAADEHKLDISHARIIDPEKSEELPNFCTRLERLDRYKKMGVTDARSLMLNPNYFGAMMTQYGQADG